MKLAIAFSAGAQLLATRGDNGRLVRLVDGFNGLTGWLLGFVAALLGWQTVLLLALVAYPGVVLRCRPVGMLEVEQTSPSVGRFTQQYKRPAIPRDTQAGHPHRQRSSWVVASGTQLMRRLIAALPVPSNVNKRSLTRNRDSRWTGLLLLHCS